MFPLMEVAVKNNWTAVFFDPATEGLVNDCLTFWGANGKHDLVEKTVICLAEGLGGDLLERQIALTHLMDARPWVGNPRLLEKVMEKLNGMLANETFPALYQSALLLAWDLMNPAMEKGQEQTVLTLLATLHFHADEDAAGFPDRSHIARHWLFERSNPELIHRFATLAYKAGQLNHFPLLGEMAAPVLLKHYFTAPSTEKPGYLKIFAEMKESTRSVLAEALAEAQNEEAVQLMIPILRVCGVDTGLSLQLCSWVAKGSRELKLNLIGMIEEMGDPAGGPALRLALFDDAEEIASLSARVIGKIHFTPGIPVLLKAAKIRETRFPVNEVYLISVCQALGDLAQPETLPFLLDIARKRTLLRGKNFSLPVRLEAIRAITRINQPEAWHFVESLMEEKNPVLQEELEKIIHERSGHLS
jgi:HEAT repeat protein